MKIPLFVVITLTNISLIQPSEMNLAQQIEGYQQLGPPHQMMHDQQPGRQRFVHESEMRNAQAQSLFAGNYARNI